MLSKPQSLLHVDRLREIVDYNPETGVVYWRPRMPSNCPNAVIRSRINRHFAGNPVGAMNSDGYLHFQAYGNTITVHRAAWALFHGSWPDEQIDHINGDKTDNRISNLRAVDAKANSQNRSRPANNKSGHVGVHYCKTSKKWLAKIQGRRIGSFDDYASAVEARKAAAVEAGFHPNHGRVNASKGAVCLESKS